MSARLQRGKYAGRIILVPNFLQSHDSLGTVRCNAVLSHSPIINIQIAMPEVALLRRGVSAHYNGLQGVENGGIVVGIGPSEAQTDE